MSDVAVGIDVLDRVELEQPTNDDGREPCPDCGKRYFPAGMGVHRASAHGVRSKRSGKESQVECPECGKSYRKSDLPRHRRKLHGIYAGRGPGRPSKEQDPELNVDDIFYAALGLLFPKGTVPVEKLRILQRWRDDTQRMLDEVTGG